jgi:tetratricopeptide (TPR) repeat protein
MGKISILEECPHCGHRGTTSTRKHKRQRNHDLAEVVRHFVDKPDDADFCCQALHTLMTYDSKTWFHDVCRTYGQRFEKDTRIQLLIAQGLCRFGEYKEAMTYCRKAIVLGATKEAQELIELCHTLLEATEMQTEENLQIRHESPFKAYLPMASVLIALIALLVSQGISSVRSHYAWLVNGTLSPYSFNLDKKSYAIAAGEQKRLKMQLGKHTLQIGDQPDVEFSYNISLVKQLFSKHLLVLNPDATALFAIGNTNNQYRFGEQIHALSGVGTPLFNFASRNIDTDETNQFYLFRPETHAAMVKKLEETGIPHAPDQYARRIVQLNPNTPEAPLLLDIATRNMSQDDAFAFLEAGRQATPLRLAWHIFYQDYMTLNHSDSDLTKEYVTLCKEHEDAPEFFYLLARVLPSEENAKSLFEHSEKGRGCGGYGYYALAFDLFQRGHASDALEYSEKALDKNPANPGFETLNQQIHLALRQYEALLSQTTTQLESGQSGADRVSDQVLYLTLLGDHLQAEALAEKYYEKKHAELPRQWLPLVNARRYYAVGNIKAYINYSQEAGRSRIDLEELLHTDRMAEAHEFAKTTDEIGQTEHLLLYCHASRMGLLDIAAEHLKSALEETEHQTLHQRAATSLLAADRAPDLRSVERLSITPPEKALLCTALGFKFPDNQPAFFERAARYNFTPEYPQRLIVKAWQPIRTPAAQNQDNQQP